MITEADVVASGYKPADVQHARGDAINEAVVALVRDWIRTYCTTANKFVQSGKLGSAGSSYGWKHRAEGTGGFATSRRFVEAPGVGQYVSNGDFIVAALREGFSAKSLDSQSPNLVMNMRLLTKQEWTDRHNPSAPPRNKCRPRR